MSNLKISVTHGAYDFSGTKGKIILKWKSNLPFKKPNQKMNMEILAGKISEAVQAEMEKYFAYLEDESNI